MIKKILFAGVILILTNHLLIGQTYSEFSYQSPYGDQGGLKIIPSLDGGYVIMGIAYYSNSDPFDSLLIMKVDSLGNQLWRKTYGQEFNGWYGTDIVSTPDSGYLICGRDFDFGSLLKVNSIGDSLWLKGYFNDRAVDMTYTVDSNLVILNIQNCRIIKVNLSGDTLWSRQLLPFSYGSSIDTLSDGFVVAGTNSNFSAAFIIRTDTLGNTIWSKYFSMGNYTFVSKILNTNDGIAVFGRSDLQNYICKFDYNGDSLWSIITNESSDYGIYNNTSQFAISGTNSGYGSIALYDSTGFISNQQFTVLSYINGFYQTYNNLFIGTGSLNNSVFLVIPSITSGITKFDSNKGLIYPNPTSSNLYLTDFNGFDQEYIIYNIVGEIICSGSVDSSSRIDISNLTPGVYQIIMKTTNESFRFIKD